MALTLYNFFPHQSSVLSAPVSMYITEVLFTMVWTLLLGGLCGVWRTFMQHGRKCGEFSLLICICSLWNFAWRLCWWDIALTLVFLDRLWEGHNLSCHTVTCWVLSQPWRQIRQLSFRLVLFLSFCLWWSSNLLPRTRHSPALRP